MLKPSKSNAAAMKELGFTVEEFQSGALKLPDIIDRIKESTKGWTDAEKSSAIARAFGVEAQTGMNALINQGGDALRNLTKETENARGYTQKLSRELMNSSKNGVERFKANLEVLQINIGQKLLPTLSPLIEKVNQVIDSFSKASPEVQDFWVKVGLGVAVAYPVLNMLGNFSSALGGVFKIAGKGVELVKTARNIATLGTTATEAGASVGLLSKAGSLLGFAFTPTGAVVLGTLAVGGAIAYFAEQAREAHRRSEEWGTAVSVEQASQLQEFKTKVDEVNHAMTDFGTGAVEVNKVTESVKNLVTEIHKLADDNLAKDIDLAKKLGLSDEAVQALTEHTNQVKDNVQQMSDEVIKIYQNAADNHRQLSEEEKSIVLANQNELINTQLELMEYSDDERLNMMKAFNGQVDELNDEQLKKARGVVEEWTKEENKSYKERLDGYKQLMEQIKGEDEKSVKARAEIKAKMEQLEAEHTAKMEAYSRKWHEIESRIVADALKNSPAEQRQGILNQVKKMAEELGYTYDEMAIKFQTTFSKIQEGHSMWAQTTNKMSETMKLANTQWNAMVWDEKTGELKTNAVEEVQKALEAEGGWDAMQFILKEANLETNARLTIGEALVASGQWDSLKPEEKELVVKGKAAVSAILESKERMNQWNNLPTEVKEILGKNEGFLSSAEGAKQALTQWNLMTPTEKALTLKDLASPDIKVVQGRIDMMTGKQLPIEAIDKTASTVESVLYGVNSIQQTSPIDINATDQTGEQAASAYAGINAIRQDSPIGIDATNRTQGEVSAASNAVNAVKQNSPVGISAQNNTSTGINAALSSLAALPQFKFIDVITRFFTQKHAHGTNYHPGGLAVVNDQRNSTYREMVTLPDGRSFIPEGRDVLLPLPRGSKVLRADKTRRLMREMGVPKYAGGVGIPADAKFIREMEQAQRNITVQTTSVQNGQDTDKVVSEMRILRSSLEKLLTAILEKSSDVYLDNDIISLKTYEQHGAIYAREGI
ncbi:Phage tail length tape-measure protein [Streptococcus oralis]|uniref:Phage tail length tape-measure protein n=1 Tax=Streptococcus oralis TaxID=1303 RepID=A0A139RIU4_STROR|nr:Phage tail length tape-measure protein [Streptococcus oralis]